MMQGPIHTAFTVACATAAACNVSTDTAASLVYTAQGPIHTALTVAREEGVMKLWSGATATTIRQGRCGACAEL